MADMASPVVFMGRGAWQNLAEPAALESFIFKSGEFTLFTWALIISSVFVLFGLSLSSYLLLEHLSGYNVPEEQKWLIGIILMVPIYTLTAYASLCFPFLSIYFKIMGDCYEAFALYSFGRYLIACMGGEEMAVQRLAKQGTEGAHEPLLDKESGPQEIVHPLPLRWITSTWTFGRSFYDSAKFGIVQYIIIKVSCSCAAFILSLFDLYGEGEFDFSQGYPYITIIQNFSQMWALYCLVQFYYATKHELHAIHPLSKFLCFKAVVFVTWWQGVVIALLFATGVAVKWLPGHPSKQQTDMLQTNLQDFIICIEMAIAAVAHIYVYPAKPYRRESHNNLNTIDSVAEELEEDIEVAATSVKESVKDVIMGGGEDIVEDVKITVTQAVEPVESGFSNFNDAFQENVSKMNEKLHDNVHKINENIHEKVHKWGGRKSEEVVKEGEYLVSRDDKEDDEIVQTEERVRVEHDDDDKEGQSDQPGVVKEEVSGTTTSRSANEDVSGEETISFKQQKEKSDSSEKKVTSSQTKETDDRGRVMKDDSMDVKEKYHLNSHGGVASKETVAHKIERNDTGQVVNEEVSEEQEERDEKGDLLLKKVKRDGEEEKIEDHLHDSS
ncbi:hypothetical protein M758_4G255400 [Ceratodon purpureus]|nr:hypothetical protein M758_4G255400 [Ceratodon purpureus]